jgi:hypothetical protein
MRLKSVFAAAAAACALAGASSAGAAVIYQSIPDLTVAPDVEGWCSQCEVSAEGQTIGQNFTLAAPATLDQLSFTVTSYIYWPTSVTVDIFADAPVSPDDDPASLLGPDAAGELGAHLFHRVYDSFDSEVDIAGLADLLTVSLGGLRLGPGTYNLMLTNPADLGIPGYLGGAGRQIAQELGAGLGAYPATGQEYTFIGGYDGAVRLTGTSGTPEPGTWALVITGFSGVGAALRRRRAAAA